jgi:hypothetical protein
MRSIIRTFFKLPRAALNTFYFDRAVNLKKIGDYENALVELSKIELPANTKNVRYLALRGYLSFMNEDLTAAAVCFDTFFNRVEFSTSLSVEEKTYLIKFVSQCYILIWDHAQGPETDKEKLRSNLSVLINTDASDAGAG